MSSWDRKVRDHFTEGDLNRQQCCGGGEKGGRTHHDGETDGTHQGVTHEKTQWTTISESVTGTEEQTRTAASQ